MAELKPVHEDLIKAGYRRPSEKEFREAGYTEDYATYFNDYEAGILRGVSEGKIRFSRELDTLPPDAEEFDAPDTELPPPPKTPTVVEVPKPKRPSFAYPGYHEPD